MTSTEYLLFRADELLLCADAASVHCIHDEAHVHPEVGTHAWFAGLAVVEGSLLPITDLGVYFGGKPTTGRVLEMAHDLGIVGLRIDEVVGVSDNALSKGDSGEAVIKSNAQTFRFLDLRKLVQSEKFLHIQSETV